MELIIISIALILGIIWGLYFKISIVFFLPCLLVLLLFIKREYKKYLIIFTISVLISNAYICVLEKRFNTKYENIDTEVTIVGTVISEPKVKKSSTEFIILVKKIEQDISCKGTKILVNINSTDAKVKYGNEIEIYGKLKDADLARNDGGFNYRQYLKIKGIYKTIHIKKSQVKIMKENDLNILDNGMHYIRTKIKESVKKILPEKEANFLIAIVIGDKEELDEDIQNNFRKSSLSHVLAVSGMHVSYIVLGITFILNKIKVSKNFIKVLLILFLIFFILLTGGSPSVERACIMTIYVIIGSLIHRRTNILNSIAFSSILILSMNPYNILDMGFILSFGGTLGIVLIYPKLKNFFKQKIFLKNKVSEKIIDVLLVTLSANLVLFPIILYYFNTISTLFLLSNLLVFLLIGIILILGFLLVFFSFIFYYLSTIIGVIEKMLIDILLKSAEIIGNISFSQIYFITPKLHIIFLYYILLFLFLYGKENKVKKLKKIIPIVLILFILFNFVFEKIIPKDLKIYFIDVGQRGLYSNKYAKK